jgi:hypothetical protein
VGKARSAAKTAVIAAEGIMPRCRRSVATVVKVIFFVVVTIIALYQQWLPFLLTISYVVLHHGLIGTLVPTHVYNHSAALAHP